MSVFIKLPTTDVAAEPAMPAMMIVKTKRIYCSPLAVNYNGGGLSGVKRYG